MKDYNLPHPIPFGRYELLSLLARGGMGEVYLARTKSFGAFEKTCAIKKILPHLSNDQTFVRRFIDEGRTLVRLQHSNIVQVFDMGSQDGDIFMAMEYVRGTELRSLLRALNRLHRRLSIEASVHIIAEVLKGLDYAHRCVDDEGKRLNIVHRDISPSNIMMSNAGDIKLIDFGIAKAASRLEHSITGQLQGKFCYMSPEQARGEVLDARSDLFSVGVVLYEMLTGQRPFDGQRDLQILEAVKQEEPLLPSIICDDVDAELEQIVVKALAKSREDRYQTADQFLVALLSYRGSKYHQLTPHQLVTSIGQEVFVQAEQAAIDGEEYLEQVLSVLQQGDDELTKSVSLRVNALQSTPSDILDGGVSEAKRRFQITAVFVSLIMVAVILLFAWPHVESFFMSSDAVSAGGIRVSSLDAVSQKSDSTVVDRRRGGNSHLAAGAQHGSRESFSSQLDAAVQRDANVSLSANSPLNGRVVGNDRKEAFEFSADFTPKESYIRVLDGKIVQQGDRFAIDGDGPVAFQIKAVDAIACHLVISVRDASLPIRDVRRYALRATTCSAAFDTASEGQAVLHVQLQKLEVTAKGTASQKVNSGGSTSVRSAGRAAQAKGDSRSSGSSGQQKGRASSGISASSRRSSSKGKAKTGKAENQLIRLSEVKINVPIRVRFQGREYAKLSDIKPTDEDLERKVQIVPKVGSGKIALGAVRTLAQLSETQNLDFCELNLRVKQSYLPDDPAPFQIADIYIDSKLVVRSADRANVVLPCGQHRIRITNETSAQVLVGTKEVELTPASPRMSVRLGMEGV